ncbi:DUF6241 domain-containing protein [Metabacillus malikii]|uniref:Uncharacterized protein n=1 Tax=Metabacillus malikii TaxID=1504265 RepID=A0ABT9ZK04_9BACI|nr:DUF6241 domain-containing protein [Metabacillus malikii]MDQ0232101.1 hypothetical protein [Metabacillus malikii]
MKKILIIIGSSIIVAGAIFYFTFTGLSEKPTSPKKAATMTVEETNTGKAVEIEEVNKKPVEEEFPLDMEEYRIKDAIHGMSHQKIKADKKWGFIPLTSDRVSRLLEIVEANKANYKHSTVYLEILNRWAKKDFSRVDKDHNEIWELQNGTIGRATGILSSEEEMEFIQKYYNVDQ